MIDNDPLFIVSAYGIFQFSQYLCVCVCVRVFKRNKFLLTIYYTRERGLQLNVSD